MCVNGGRHEKKRWQLSAYLANHTHVLLLAPLFPQQLQMLGLLRGHKLAELKHARAVLDHVDGVGRLLVNAADHAHDRHLRQLDAVDLVLVLVDDLLCVDDLVDGQGHDRLAQGL